MSRTSNPLTGSQTLLGNLAKGVKAVIVKVGRSESDSDLTSERLTEKLLQMGFLEGSIVEIIHEAPFGGDPVAVRVRGGLVALRRNEANLVEVSILTEEILPEGVLTEKSGAGNGPTQF